MKVFDNFCSTGAFEIVAFKCTLDDKMCMHSSKKGIILKYHCLICSVERLFFLSHPQIDLLMFILTYQQIEFLQNMQRRVAFCCILNGTFCEKLF